jgi:hypothetical protein
MIPSAVAIGKFLEIHQFSCLDHSKHAFGK